MTEVIRDVPAPWQPIQGHAVGGLFQVGYAAGSDLLLVLSSQGRGVFDCLTGVKVARDDDEAHDFFDPIRLTAIGIGPLDGHVVRVVGLFGGGLPLTTCDGWRMRVQAREWPTQSVYLVAPDSDQEICIGDDGACEWRACGFSETGRSFVIATSCGLMIFARLAV
ncbi:hypothetical protein TA3x_001741 [Tundrisphaera sp. TA3]|uniref:hypothetical protein n=1 Tax=Tundrisphaera sp. TA3 TaxID=3435775 RepID=UPI003EBD7A89